jgi:hypothetical protein
VSGTIWQNLGGRDDKYPNEVSRAWTVQYDAWRISGSIMLKIGQDTHLI